MPSSPYWWGHKVRQFRTHLRASVTPAERAELDGWTTAAQRRMFDAMHVADRRHGLDVVGSLRGEGVQDHDVLIAGLIHDAGKGDTGVGPRVAYSLGQRYGTWVWRIAGRIPGFDEGLRRLQAHADASATMAAEAGCSPRTVDLSRYQDAPRDPEFGELLRLADEAN